MLGTAKVYYDLLNGEGLSHQSYGREVEIDFEHDYQSIKDLNDRVKNTVGLIILTNNQYAQDFIESNGVKVNLELLATLPQDRRHEALDFSIPDPNAPLAPPVFVKALSEQITELKTRDASIQDDQLFIMEILVNNNLI